MPVAVLDYQTPDQVLTSGNLGDYIQTLALLGNLARLAGVTFTGEDGLGELATELQARVRLRSGVPDATGAVHLLARRSRLQQRRRRSPHGTWMFAFGWHMHPLYDLRYDFPYHPNIRPLFLSFHLNRLDMLSDEAQAYLRAARAHRLPRLEHGVPAPQRGHRRLLHGLPHDDRRRRVPDPRGRLRRPGAVGVIDLPPKPAGRGARNVRLYTHQSDEVRNDVAGRRGPGGASRAWPNTSGDLDRAVTGRLHALPAR